jgi:hypothetical protein
LSGILDTYQSGDDVFQSLLMVRVRIRLRFRVKVRISVGAKVRVRVRCRVRGLLSGVDDSFQSPLMVCGVIW